jgi:hypothetical protein
MREKMNRNISVYYRFKFSQNMLIIGPVLVPYMLFKGLSYSEMMFLQSISAVAVVLFEVPTGSIADRVSRKFSGLCPCRAALWAWNDFQLRRGLGYTL